MGKNGMPCVIHLPMQEPAAEPGRVRGIFEIGDPNFGNMWTNIPFKTFQSAGFHYGDRIQVSVSHEDQQVFSQKLLFERSFGFVGKGELMIYTNELMRIGLAVNQGDLVQTYHLGYGSEWTVQFSCTMLDS